MAFVVIIYFSVVLKNTLNKNTSNFNNEKVLLMEKLAEDLVQDYSKEQVVDRLISLFNKTEKKLSFVILDNNLKTLYHPELEQGSTFFKENLLFLYHLLRKNCQLA